MRKGQKHTEETKKKQSERRLLNPSLYWLGKKRDQETIEKIKKTVKGRYRGDENPSWKGGKWRWIKRQAKIRDNYTCRHCGLQDEEIMDVDHIKSKSNYPDLITQLNNLVTLCPNCHRRKTLKEYKDKMYARK